MKHRDLSNADPEVYDALKSEIQRQESDSLEMIASENFVPRQVLQAQGSIMTNKYAEGYPGNRYYAGCEHHDKVENLAMQRACDLFNADHANVQPHSGSTANFAVFSKLVGQGGKILGPVLSHGGHLSHGHDVNFSGDLFDFSTYSINEETERFEKEDVLEAARNSNPDMIVTGFSAYPREFDFKMFREVADEVDALLMADIAHVSGLVAADVHQQPFPHCDVVTTTTHKSIRGARGGMILCKDEYAEQIDKAVFPYSQGGPLMHQIAAKAVSFKEAQRPSFTEYAEQIKLNAKALASKLKENGIRLVSGGTDNHMVLLDLRNEEITGRKAEQALENAGIVANKNAVPFDPEPPMVTSGIRLGTPALTTRGLEEDTMEHVAEMVSEVINNPDNDQIISSVSDQVEEILGNHPLYEQSEVDY